MRINDAIIGAVLVIFAAAEIAYARTFPSLHGQAYGPDLFPSLIGCGLILCGSILIFRGLALKRAQASTAKWIDYSSMAESTTAKVNAALILFFLLLYILLSDIIGFIPLSMITLVVLLYRLGTPILSSVLIAIATTAVIQLLFAKVLLVPLPSGWLQSLL